MGDLPDDHGAEDGREKYRGKCVRLEQPPVGGKFVLYLGVGSADAASHVPGS